MVRQPQERQPVMRLPQGEVGEGEGVSPPLKLHLSLSQRENQVKEGEGKRLPPNLDHPPSCNSSTEITALGKGETQREYQVKPPKLDHPPSCNNSTEIPHARRENQVKEGEGKRLLLNLHHHPSSSSQEIPVHHPGGQLA